VRPDDARVEAVEVLSSRSAARKPKGLGEILQEVVGVLFDPNNRFVLVILEALRRGPERVVEKDVEDREGAEALLSVDDRQDSARQFLIEWRRNVDKVGPGDRNERPEESDRVLI